MDHSNESQIKGKRLAQRINQLDWSLRDEIIKLEKELFDTQADRFYVEQPLFVDWGKNIHVGENFYANSDCLFLDYGDITIGDNVLFGPRVMLLTAEHAIDPELRYEKGLEAIPSEIVIKDNVWIGAGSIVNPGVTIEAGSIIGSGSVVTKDVPANVVVAGNPAKVVREIEPNDKENFRLLYDTIDNLGENIYFEKYKKLNSKKKIIEHTMIVDDLLEQRLQLRDDLEKLRIQKSESQDHISSLEEQKSEAQKYIDDLENNYEDLAKEHVGLEKKYVDLKKEQVDLENKYEDQVLEIMAKSDENSQLINSLPYKVGRFTTLPIRVMIEAWKNLKKNRG